MKMSFSKARRNNEILMGSLGHTKLVADEAKQDTRSWALKNKYVQKVKNEKLITPQQLNKAPPQDWESPWRKHSKKKASPKKIVDKYSRRGYVIDDEMLQARTTTAKANE